MSVRFQNSQTKEVKEVPEGFSWTTLFFSIWPAVFRGDVKWALIMFGLALVTFGGSAFVFPFIYNKLYMKELVTKGFISATDTDKAIARRYGIIFAD